MKLPKFWWLPFGKAPEIKPDELKKWLEEEKRVQLIDSRTELEYRQGTIRGAVHAPVTGLPGSIDRLQLNPNKPVILLCYSGHRSLPGTRLLRARGMDAYSLKGGISTWKKMGNPLG